MSCILPENGGEEGTTVFRCTMFSTKELCRKNAPFLTAFFRKLQMLDLSFKSLERKKRDHYALLDI